MANESQLADRAAAVQKQLAGLSNGMAAKQTLTVVLGFGLLAAVAAFYWYGYSQVKPLLEPKTLVDTGTGLALQNMPMVRTEAVNLAKDQLPGLAEFASATALEQLPSMREKMEEMLLAGADKALTEAREPLRVAMVEMVKKHKQVLADGGKELTKSAPEADKYLKSLSEVAEKELGADLDRTVGTMAAAVEGFGSTLANATIDRAKRSSLQVMLREMLMLTKRLALEMDMDPKDVKEAAEFIKTVPGVVSPKDGK